MKVKISAIKQSVNENQFLSPILIKIELMGFKTKNIVLLRQKHKNYNLNLLLITCDAFWTGFVSFHDYADASYSSFPSSSLARLRGVLLHQS